ncbi:MAG: DUF5050 domain-containing protein [Clostridia bacterium]|nr:DUF5050 domain-containing protein [Clostridia bacterium]
MKNSMVFVLVVCMFVSLITFSSAEEVIKVKVNSDLVDFDVNPVIVDGTTLVPVRAILEKLGMTVDWNADTSTVVGTKDATVIELTINSKKAKKNGIEMELGVPAKIINGRTFVPVRFIAESLDAVVSWDDASKTVDIKLTNNNNSKPSFINGGWAVEDEDWIYFYSSQYWDISDLYKVKKDGTELTKIASDAIGSIKIIGDWIYFTREGEKWTSNLYKVKKDGTELTKICEDDISGSITDGEYIYYVNKSDNNKLYKIDLDGMNKTKISDDEISQFDLYKNNIIYIIAEDELLSGNRFITTGKVFKMQKDGTTKAQISNNNAVNLVVNKDDIYYINLNDENKMYKISIHGESDTKVFNDICDEFTINGEWIYYSNKSDSVEVSSDAFSVTGGKLYKIKVDGTEKTKLTDIIASDIDVTSEWIYFAEYRDNGSRNYEIRRKIKTDGTNLTDVEFIKE